MNSGMSCRLLISIVQFRAMAVEGVHKCGNAGGVLAFLEESCGLFCSTLTVDNRFNRLVEGAILDVTSIGSGEKVDNQGVELIDI